MQELTFVLGPARPAAEIWETLGAAGITMEASATYPGLEGRNVRIVLRDEDAEAGRAALLAAKFGAIDRHEVLIADIAVRAGELGRMARRIADSGATLTTLFMATGNRVVIGADDLDEVRRVLSGPAESSES